MVRAAMAERMATVAMVAVVTVELMVAEMAAVVRAGMPTEGRRAAAAVKVVQARRAAAMPAADLMAAEARRLEEEAKER